MQLQLDLGCAADSSASPGGLGCAVEIAATMAAAIEAARARRWLSREAIAHNMSFLLGERVSEATLNAYTSQAQDSREVSLRRAMAFDAAVGADVLLSLYARKRGDREVITSADAALLEWARLHQKGKQIAARMRQLETSLKGCVGT